jgi:hypothetical protein
MAPSPSWDRRAARLASANKPTVLPASLVRSPLVNLERALHDLRQAVDERGEPNAASRLLAGRNVLVVQGCEALGIEHSASLPLHDLIAIAVDAPPTAARRAFGVLLVHALAVEGLVASKSHRGQLDRNVCAPIENTLPAVLQRFGYPFGSETDERRRSLDRLYATIDDLLQLLEPTFPPGIQGLYAG